MIGQKNPMHRWSPKQVKSFADRAIAELGRDCWKHLGEELKRCICDSVVVSVLSGNHEDSQFSPEEIAALRNDIYEFNAVL